MIYHVTPINDIQEHEEAANCMCEPEVMLVEGGDFIVIHSAFDGRLGVEWTNEILNRK